MLTHNSHSCTYLCTTKTGFIVVESIKSECYHEKVVFYFLNEHCN